MLQLPIPKPDKGDHGMRKTGGGTRVAAHVKMEGENTKRLILEEHALVDLMLFSDIWRIDKGVCQFV